MTVVCLDCARWEGCTCVQKAMRSRSSQKVFWYLEQDGRSLLTRRNLGGLDKQKEIAHTRGNPMLKPLGNRILVRLLSRYGDEENKLKLTIVDGKRHYEGIRKGEVMAVSDSVHSVMIGDIVVFRGDSGESFSMDDGGVNDGTDWRRLRTSDLLAVEEPSEHVEILQPVLQESLS